MTNPYSELIKELRNGCIGLSALHSVLAQRQYDIQRRTNLLLCILTFLALVIALCLVSLELRLGRAVETAPLIEDDSRPAVVPPYVPRFDPALPERPNFDKPTLHHYAA